MKYKTKKWLKRMTRLLNIKKAGVIEMGGRLYFSYITTGDIHDPTVCVFDVRREDIRCGCIEAQP
jgi:hypothetical protein